MTDHEIGALYRGLAKIDQRLTEMTESQATHATEVRSSLTTLTERIDGLDSDARELRERQDADEEREAVRVAAEAEDRGAREGRKTLTRILVAVVTLVALPSAGWLVTDYLAERDANRVARVTVAEIKDTVAAHGVEDDREHAQSRRERTETARALDRLTGAIEESRRAQAQQAASIERRIDRLDERVRRIR